MFISDQLLSDACNAHPEICVQCPITIKSVRNTPTPPIFMCVIFSQYYLLLIFNPCFTVFRVTKDFSQDLSAALSARLLAKKNTLCTTGTHMTTCMKKKKYSAEKTPHFGCCSYFFVILALSGHSSKILRIVVKGKSLQKLLFVFCSNKLSWQIFFNPSCSICVAPSL